jgi:glycosyltransferase involved in cell wall biosynthesis
MLEAIFTGYPHFKLKDEQGIPIEKIKTFPWVQAPYMMLARFGIFKWNWLNNEWGWWAGNSLDNYVARQIKEKRTLIALSGAGLRSGKVTQQYGGKYICDRGSSHIRFQNEILKEEYNIWKLPYAEIDVRSMNRDEAEYEQADRITVPSEFVRKSFLTKGVPAEKISKIIYGARLERFSKQGSPDKSKFTVLWVGGVSIRKGFMYLLEAFTQLKHPNKELRVVGPMTEEIKSLLNGNISSDVKFLGAVPNENLPELYSTSTVFVLPSLEEGLAMVQGEALACGCPIIASTNSGAEDLITDGKEGFIIPIRSSTAILEKFQLILDTAGLRDRLSQAALERVKQMGGWDSYGNNFVNLLNSMG